VPVAVPIVAGTAIKGVAATVLMRGVLQRHPNAFLITLHRGGITLPLHRSQEHIRHDIAKGLAAQGRAPDSPVVIVGHSQGALASMRYAVDHPEQVLHVISVGAPWHGTRTAATVSRLYGWTGRDLAPALSDMAPNSPFLMALRADLPAIGDRVTNIYSTHEVVISPYANAHIDVPGVTNVLIASEQEYAAHMKAYPELTIGDLILGKVNHLAEMSSPAVRSMIWAKVDEVTAHLRAKQATPEPPAPRRRARPAPVKPPTGSPASSPAKGRKAPLGDAAGESATG
jgi:pimeloyl-ACP methyl ester carboxylesterase